MSDPMQLVMPRLRPGHRGRIGVIQPAPGVLLEYEWATFMPAEVLYPVGRVRMTSATLDEYRRVGLASADVAQDLASAGSDVIAYACSVGSLFAGPEWERKLIAGLSTAAGKPAISIADASMRALRSLGAQRIAVMTPYPPAIDELVHGYATRCGFTVVGSIDLPVGIAGVADLDASEIASWAIAAMAKLPEADALWIPCTAVRTLACIDDIERATGRIVVSGTQALLWDALRTIGVDDKVACGALLRQ